MPTQVQPWDLNGAYMEGQQLRLQNDTLKQKNALAAQTVQNDTNALGLRQQEFDAARANALAAQRAQQKLQEMVQYRDAPPEVKAQYVAAQAQQHPEFAQTPFAQLPPDQAFDAMYKAAEYAATGKPPALPFNQTSDYQKLTLQGQQAADLERQRAASAAALERQKAGSAAALERMKLQGGAGAGGGPPARPLPVGALKLVDEAQQAINASSESLSLVDSAIGTVESGKVNLGLLSNAVSRTKNAIGSSDPQSRAYSDVKQTLEKLRNNYLLLAKGVQTEGDATRAWNSEIGENVQNDNNLAAQQLKKAKGLIERAIQAQSVRIDNIYANFGTSRPNAAPQAAPGGWSIEPVN